VVVYLDTDTLVLSPLPQLIEYYLAEIQANDALQLIYAEKGKEGKHNGFNAGFMVLKPSYQIYRDMNAYLEERKEPPSFFGNYLDCTEQAFFNDFFIGYAWAIGAIRPQIDNQDRRSIVGSVEQLERREERSRRRDTAVVGVSVARPDIFAGDYDSSVR